MRRRLITSLGTGALLSATLIWLIAASGVSAGNPCFHGYEMPKDTTAATTIVALDPCAFAPTIASVPVGATVTFRNASPFSHVITGADQAWGSRDAEVAPGETVSHTFETAGLYPYACVLHPGMSGVIVVGDARAIAAAPITPRQSATADPMPLIALGTTIGVAIGAIVSWLIGRRRMTRDATVVATAP